MTVKRDNSLSRSSRRACTSRKPFKAEETLTLARVHCILVVACPHLAVGSKVQKRDVLIPSFCNLVAYHIMLMQTNRTGKKGRSIFF